MFNPTRRAILIAATLLAACGDPEEPPISKNNAITNTDDLFDAIGRAATKSACRAHFQCPVIEYRGLSKFKDEQSCLEAYTFFEFDESRTVKASAEAGRLTLDGAAAAACLAAGAAALDALPPCALESDRLEAALLPCLGALEGKVPRGERCYNSNECARGDGSRAYCNADDLPTCYEDSLCEVVEDTCDGACSVDSVCIEGSCIARGKAGEACGDYGCAEGLGCRDVTPDGQEIQQLVCTPYGSLALGEECRSLSARYELCALGLRCIEAGINQPPRCAAPTVAQRGEPCPSYEVGRCAPGLICTPAEVCGDPLGQGAMCTFTEQCALGLACARPTEDAIGGSCAPLKQDGTSCFADDECKSGSRCDYIDDTNRRCAAIGTFSCPS